MTSTDALEQALDLISRVGWCQKAAARDVHGRATYSHSPTAVQFSLDGAIQRVTWPDHAPDPEEPELWRAADEAFQRLAELAGMNGERSPWGFIVKWQDAPGRKREDVERLIIEALQKESNE